MLMKKGLVDELGLDGEFVLVVWCRVVVVI